MKPLNRRDFIKATSLGAATLLTPTIVAEAHSPIQQSILAENSLRFRQIHLDFHTSEHIPDVAKNFDAQEFAATLKKASVNSVTAFARCHHGYIYHESKKFNHLIHPNLKNKNILKEQIEACHKQNIRVPIYVTVQWDHLTAQAHPEWLVRDENGAPIAFGQTNAFQAGFYNHLCINTPYRDFLKSYLADLFEQVPVDGLFLDIHHVFPNANVACVEGMKKLGMNAADETQRLIYYKKVMTEYKEDLTSFIRKLDKNCGIFYNGGHINPDIRNSVSTYSHLELESLPSGGWGYLHFPLTARYARTLGKDMMGMTGKFHTSWGDFHSLKNKPALEFECFTMLALNAKCSVGDQLHPNGVLDKPTYDLIGDVYAQVAQKEAWCEDAVALCDIGVLNPEAFVSQGGKINQQAVGAVRMLQETFHQFDLLDPEADFSTYKLLILPDVITLDEKLRVKIEGFVAKGGAVIASYQSGLTPDKKAFASSIFGTELVGDAPYSPDFIATKGILGQGLPQTELVMYMKGLEVKASKANVLLETNVPYFNRTWEHFSSHKHTPSAMKTGYPAVLQNGNVIYFMHPIFAQYADNAPIWCKKLVSNTIDILLKQPILQLKNAPSAVTTAVNLQAKKNRYVLHLLCYMPERRGNQFDVIEDVIPIYNIGVSALLPQKIKKVTAVPQGKNIAFKYKGNRIEFALPELNGHQMVEISY